MQIIKIPQEGATASSSKITWFDRFYILLYQG